MQVKTMTTAAGVNEIDFGNDGSQSTAHFYWLKNLGDSTLYVSANPNPIAEKDDVAELSAKGAVSVETDEGKIYILGTGKVEIHRTNSKFCPFDWQSSGSGGGGIVDAYTKTESDAKYAQKTDIPATLPANGGNADTVGGKVPEKIFYDNGLAADLNSATKSGCYATSPNTLNAPFSTWWLVDTMNYNNQFIVQKAHMVGDAARTSSYIRNYANDVWSEWKEISTTPIKSTGWITTPTDAHGAIVLPNSSSRGYLSTIVVGCYSQLLMHNDEYTFHVMDGNFNKITNSPVTYIAFYVE